MDNVSSYNILLLWNFCSGEHVIPKNELGVSILFVKYMATR